MPGLHDPPWGESDTRSKLIDPAIYARGWTEEHIRREETAGAIEIVDGKPRRRSKGRVDYTLRVKVSTGRQPVALAVIEAKAENLPPTHGLEQAKSYARCKRLNVPFAFSCNGHLFVEFDQFTGQTSPPRPMAEFPTCDELRARYEAGKGFSLAEEVAKAAHQWRKKRRRTRTPRIATNRVERLRRRKKPLASKGLREFSRRVTNRHFRWRKGWKWRGSHSLRTLS